MNTEFIEGMGKLNGDFISILEIEKILLSEELELAQQVIEQKSLQTAS